MFEYDKDKIAKFPPDLQNRKYYDSDDKEIPTGKTGRDLPALKLVKELQEKFMLDQELQDPIVSTELYSDLPQQFFCELLKIQLSPNPIIFPKIMTDKRSPVGDYIFDSKIASDSLKLEKWKVLGWPSKNEYLQWLNTPMLFAFSHCMHYCTAPRVFDVGNSRNRDKQDNAPFNFKQTLSNVAQLAVDIKTTNILSVTGFEFRNFSGTINDELLLSVRHHSRELFRGILQCAISTKTTDIVLIPYGMGVFIGHLPRNIQGKIKDSILDGIVEAISNYQGDQQITIHCCTPKDYYDKLSLATTIDLIIRHAPELDAYSLANYLQDSDLNKKVMLINAADNDWTVLLDPKKGPGQFTANHTLYHKTSDEYYALMTLFPYFSIQRLYKVVKDNFDQHIRVFDNKNIEVSDSANLKIETSEKDPVNPEIVDALKQYLQHLFNSPEYQLLFDYLKNNTLYLNKSCFNGVISYVFSSDFNELPVPSDIRYRPQQSSAIIAPQNFRVD